MFEGAPGWCPRCGARVARGGATKRACEVSSRSGRAKTVARAAGVERGKGLRSSEALKEEPPSSFLLLRLLSMGSFLTRVALYPPLPPAWIS